MARGNRMLSLGIIWNPVSDYFNEIIAELQDKIDVIAVYKEIVIEPLAFIYDIYRDMLVLDRSKIEFKLSNLFLSDSREIVIIVFAFDPSKVNYHPQKQKSVYVELDSLKREIREEYGSKISNYQFDNVFHCTDDMEEFNYSYSIVCKYFNDIPDISSLSSYM